MSVTTVSVRVDWEVHEVSQVRRRSVAGGARVVAVQLKEFFSKGIHAFPKRWNTCMERNGDYIKK
jgi:hypothetical protein